MNTTNLTIKPTMRIQAFYLFFIMNSIQTGSGIMGVPRYIFMEARQDAWISVLIAGLLVHLVMAAMFAIMNHYENTDVLGVQTDLFGKWIAKLLGTIYIIYFFFVLLSVTMDYIQVVQTFIFPRMSAWVLSLVLILLIVYAVMSGLRVAVGITFIFFFLSLWLLIFLYKSIAYMEITHFQPLLEASPSELLRGARHTSYSYLGIEILFFIYPFISNKEKAKLPAHLGLALTTFFILLVTVISIGYFSPGELPEQVWPVLVLFKIVEYSVIGRFDVLVVTEWMMVILPNMILLTWIITYITKRLYHVQQRKVLYVVAVLLLIGAGITKHEYFILQIIDTVAATGFWVAFVYPLVLLPLVWMKSKWKRRKRGGAKT
ncbi:GerAB/ArcD/ProY family transporter [Sediminibacillus halophilus]|uniref:Spore germination protein (Amino acid permease) n=1 Tax=Sediminibacillus halophilus TaxID=482461 RepID=A0A1G9VZM7_9BACI|nr:GerAB/ArcD/ProY family transporter [Sediminibacillus halophilus]SDM77768.1 spore germination protein (amino acid permease) [Sediminibacillus halophilus]